MFWWFEDYWWGFALEIVVLLYSFAGLALVCDDYMVPALETLCVRWNVQEDVAGATFMAFGSAAPEIIINAVQTIKSRLNSPSDGPAEKQDNVALGIGAIIGSGMIAFMIIPAICAIFSDKALSIKRRPFARDAGFYSIALFATIMFLQDENIMCYEAAILVGLYICYVLTVVFGRSVRKKYLRKVKGVVLERQDSFVTREKEKRKSKTPSKKNDITTPLLHKSSSRISNETSNIPRHSPNKSSTQGSTLDDGVVFWRRSENTGIDAENQGLVSGGTKEPGCTSNNKIEKDSEEKPIYPVSPLPGTGVQYNTGAEGQCEESEEEDESGCSLICVLTSPLKFLFMITCPKAVIGERFECLYPLAFIISFGWIAGFSFVVSEVVEEWVVKTGINEAFFGLTLIAIGAEIPDTIQSVTVARRGYGSMAVSNCIGSQIVNLCIGLGFSWLLGIVVSDMKPVELTKLGVRNVFDAALCQGTAVIICLFLLFGPIIYSRFNQQKLHLGKVKGYILLFIYLATLGAFGVVEYLQGAFTKKV